MSFEYDVNLCLIMSDSLIVCYNNITCPRDYKAFFMINSTEHEINYTNKWCLSRHVDGYLLTVEVSLNSSSSYGIKNTRNILNKYFDICLFVYLILYISSTIFQLCRDGSSSTVEPVLSSD